MLTINWQKAQAGHEKGQFEKPEMIWADPERGAKFLERNFYEGIRKLQIARLCKRDKENSELYNLE